MTTLALIIVLPLMALIVMAGLVLIVAMTRARPGDIPAVLAETRQIIQALAQRLPRYSPASARAAMDSTAATGNASPVEGSVTTETSQA